MIKPLKTIQKLTSGAPVTIAVIGDSLTASWMVRKGYVDFSKICCTRIIRRENQRRRKGRAGRYGGQRCLRLKWDVLEYRPDCVLIQYALNDAFLGFTAGQFKGNIRKMIDAVREDPEADIVLLTSSYIGGSEDGGFVRNSISSLSIWETNTAFQVSLTHRHWKSRMDEGETDFQSLVSTTWCIPPNWATA